MSDEARDLTAARAENEALRRTLALARARVEALEEELREARRLAAVGRVAIGVVHDVESAMTAITGHADLLLRRLAADDPCLGSATSIRMATGWGLSRTRDLLAAARPAPGMAAADVNAAVAAVTRMIEPLLGIDVRLEVSLGRDLPPVSGTASDLEHLVTSLLMNARDAVQARGRIVVETTSAELDPGRPGVLLKVSDTGAATFGRGVETSCAATPGTDLRLAAVIGIARQHGGHVDSEIEPARGSHYTVYLAAAAGEGSAAPAPAVPSVLVVEDERAVRDLIVEILEMHDHRAAPAQDGDEAVVRAQELGDDLVLLVADVRLDGAPALPLVARLAGARPGLKVLWVSGELDDPRTDTGIPLAAQSVIHKPFTVDVLMRAVRGLLGAH